MATNKSVEPIQDSENTLENLEPGFDCEFITNPPEAVQSECPVCMEILREPYQASCCGYSFCKTCIKRIQNDKKPCPTCNEEEFTTFYNKGLQRSLYKFRIYCTHKQQGCEWTGELGQLDKHLNLNPQPNKQLEGCQYSEIDCEYCHNVIQRHTITTHQADLCLKRPFSCEYCNDYDSDYDDVINHHWSVCGLYLVQCPNECDSFYQRRCLQSHVTNECPLTVIDCDFHHVGCDVKLPRKDMQVHLNDTTTVKKHAHQLLSRMTELNSEKQVFEKTLLDNETEHANLKAKMEALDEESIRVQKENLQLRNEMDSLNQEFRRVQDENVELHGQTDTLNREIRRLRTNFHLQNSQLREELETAQIQIPRNVYHSRYHRRNMFREVYVHHVNKEPECNNKIIIRLMIVLLAIVALASGHVLGFPLLCVLCCCSCV